MFLLNVKTGRTAGSHTTESLSLFFLFSFLSKHTTDKAQHSGLI